MSDSGAELPGGPTPATLAILGAILAWILWLVFTRCFLRGNEPPEVPSAIPWLGHAVPFIRDRNGFIQWVGRRMPNEPITSITMAGRRIYIITDATLANQVYRQARTFILNPFHMTFWSSLGCTKDDMKLLKVGMTIDSKHDENDGPGILNELHAISVSHLHGPALNHMSGIFNDHMFRRIDEKFPAEQEDSYEWKEVEVYEFVKEAWSSAAVATIFGSHISELWPRVYDWLWDFDENILLLFTQLPRFVIPKSFGFREEGLLKLQEWEQNALQAYADGRVQEKDAEWDPYWGLRFLRVRAKLAQDAGVSTRGRAALQMAFLWGANTNSIPVAAWAMIQALSSPLMMQRIQPELLAAQISSNSLDMEKLMAQPHLKTLVQETLRWAVASPVFRQAKDDTELGGFKIRRGVPILLHVRSIQMDQNTWEFPSDPQFRASDFVPDRFLESNASMPGETEKSHLDNKEVDTGKTKTGDVSTKFLDKNVKKRTAAALMPFGGGKYMCPGRHFANHETSSGLAAMFLKLEFKVDEKSLRDLGFPKVNLSQQGGMMPDRPFRVLVRRRRGAK